MKDIISKELLSEVLGVEVIKFDDGKYQYPNNDMSKVYYMINGTFGMYSSINIHELAHRCKEWALTQRLPFGTTGRLQGSCYIKSTNRGSYCDAEIWTTALMEHAKYQYAEDFCEDTEPEAIFKACQWILDNKGSK